jgi:hypothetical protein
MLLILKLWSLATELDLNLNISRSELCGDGFDKLSKMLRCIISDPSRILEVLLIY